MMQSQSVKVHQDAQLFLLLCTRMKGCLGMYPFERLFGDVTLGQPSPEP